MEKQGKLHNNFLRITMSSSLANDITAVLINHHGTDELINDILKLIEPHINQINDINSQEALSLWMEPKEEEDTIIIDKYRISPPLPAKITSSRPKITINKDNKTHTRPTLKQEPDEAPQISTVVAVDMPNISDFLAEVNALSPMFNHSDTLKKCKVVAAQTHRNIAEWRVKQFRLYLAGVETGLLTEVQESLKGKDTMTRHALTFYDMLVTLTNKASKTNRNSRCPMAINGRLCTKAFEALAKARDVVPAALIYAQEVYTFENYEKANALALNPNTTDEVLTQFMNYEFCGGWFSTPKGQEALDGWAEIYGSRTKSKAPQNVQELGCVLKKKLDYGGHRPFCTHTDL